MINNMSNKTQRFCSLATSHAKCSPMLQRHGCIAVVNGRVVGTGFNNYRNYSRDGFMRSCCSCHAEVAAIRDAAKRNHINIDSDINPLVVQDF